MLRCHRCEDTEGITYCALSDLTPRGSVRLCCVDCLTIDAAKMKVRLNEKDVRKFIRTRLMRKSDCLIILKGHNLIGI